MRPWTFVLLACVYVGLLTRGQPGPADAAGHAGARRLIAFGHVDAPADTSDGLVRKRGGLRLPDAPLGVILAQVPAAFLALPLARVLPWATAHDFATCLPGALLMAGTCVLFMGLLRRFGAGERLALVAALTLGTATLAFMIGRSATGDALECFAMMLALGRVLALGERPTLRAAVGAGLAFGLLVLARPLFCLLAPLFAAYFVRLVRRERDAWVLYAAAGVALIVPLSLAEWYANWLCGSWLAFGVPGVPFSGVLWLSLPGFAWSPGKALLLYSPPLLVAFWGWPELVRRHGAAAWFVLAIGLASVLLVAWQPDWHGDPSYGPRTLTQVVPVFGLGVVGAAARAQRGGRARAGRRAAWALVGLGLLVQAAGSAVDPRRYIAVVDAGLDAPNVSQSLRIFTPALCPIGGHAWLIRNHLLSRPAPPPWQEMNDDPFPYDWRSIGFDWWFLRWLAEARAPLASGVLAVLVVGAALASWRLRVRWRGARVAGNARAAGAAAPDTLAPQAG
jgi:hypothetical protein